MEMLTETFSKIAQNRELDWEGAKKKSKTIQNGETYTSNTTQKVSDSIFGI